MKQKCLGMMILLTITLTFFSCCNSDSESDEIFFNGEKYLVCSDEWYPYGDTVKHNEFFIFNNDANMRFIKAQDSFWFEGVTYHKASDIFPSVKTSEIDKITLDFGTKQVKIDDVFISEIVHILNGNNIVVSDADLSNEFLHINIYYKNYPAYQSKWLITQTMTGSLGIMYSETEENTAKIGLNKAMLIKSNELTEYINNLFKQ